MRSTVAGQVFRICIVVSGGLYLRVSATEFSHELAHTPTTRAFGISKTL
jgi:hypothetical protein